jgi:hypothetical protein
MTDKNMIPSLKAAGRFEALAPFDTVVDTTKYYMVEALRTIHEMESLKLNLYELVFKPVGVLEADFPEVLTRARTAGAIIVSILDRAGIPVYVPSTYFKSFPMTDGVSFERMCAIVDFGPCDPSKKDLLSQCMDHFKSYVLATLGIDSTVNLGTIPTIGYTSREQADAYELARKAKITDSNNDVSRIRELEAKLVTKDAYIKELELQIPVAPPPPVTP